MTAADISRYQRVSVVFESRPDGGLRVSSPDVPGIVLSHSDPDLVMADVILALETIISDIVKKPVRVRLTGGLETIPVPSSVTPADD